MPILQKIRVSKIKILFFMHTEAAFINQKYSKL